MIKLFYETKANQSFERKGYFYQYDYTTLTHFSTNHDVTDSAMWHSSFIAVVLNFFLIAWHVVGFAFIVSHLPQELISSNILMIMNY